MDSHGVRRPSFFEALLQNYQIKEIQDTSPGSGALAFWNPVPRIRVPPEAQVLAGKLARLGSSKLVSF